MEQTTDKNVIEKGDQEQLRYSSSPLVYPPKFQSKVELIRGKGSFDADGSVVVDGKKYRGKNTLIAVGGYPTIPDTIPGARYGIDSDGFFDLEACLFF